MNLFIVESPAKCAKIQGYLGAGWKVIATMGHIRELKPSLSSIGIDAGFEPTYQLMKSKDSAIKKLKGEYKNSKKIYLASDDDREGESIAYSVCLLLNLDVNTTPRSVFHEITERAIKESVANPRTINMNKVNAQQTRSMLDLLIGFTMSPLLWKYVAPKLSAGRCQTPALRLVIDRDDKIQNFKSEMFWQTNAIWKHASISINLDSKLDEHFKNDQDTLSYMEKVNSLVIGTVTDIKLSNWSESPPLPLITSSLQQQASSIYHINPKLSMSIAQKLYESGFITYMRTDNPIISEEAKLNGSNLIIEKYGSEYVGKNAKKSLKIKQSSSANIKKQEAHEAIRPTHFDVDKLTDDKWTDSDNKIYQLIWSRAIQSLMSDASGQNCQISIKIDNDNKKWISDHKITKFDGWKIVSKKMKIKTEPDNESDIKQISDQNEWDQINSIKVGDKINWIEMISTSQSTKTDGHYTEATLVHALEKYGIGRPSTFASLVTVIQTRQYVEKKNIPALSYDQKIFKSKPNILPILEYIEKKQKPAEKNKIISTILGRSVLKFLMEHFPNIFEYEYTANMEKNLDQIENGTLVWKDSLKLLWDSYKDKYNQMTSNQINNNQSTDNQSTLSNVSNKCKILSDNMKAIMTKNGPSLAISNSNEPDKKMKFIGWPTGINFDQISLEIANNHNTEYNIKQQNNVIGEYNGKQIVKKNGKFGDYLEYDNVTLAYNVDENIDDTISRIDNKIANIVPIKKFSNFEIRNGPYGPYIIKTSVKRSKFIPVPKDVKIESLSEKMINDIYQNGNKKKTK